jgi:hypothetical protein
MASYLSPAQKVPSFEIEFVFVCDSKVMLEISGNEKKPRHKGQAVQKGAT